jgi:hypothetical protein
MWVGSRGSEEEFKVQTNLYSAGAGVELVTRSGGNVWHGVYAYFRNEALNCQ